MFKQTIVSTLDLGLNGAFGAGVGYLYGAIFNANKKIAAQAFAISNLSAHLFNLNFGFNQ